METLELHGAKLRYHKIGKGPVLILIPGANGTGDIYMPLAKQIQDHFTVVAVDRRGYGQSVNCYQKKCQTLTVAIALNVMLKTSLN